MRIGIKNYNILVVKYIWTNLILWTECVTQDFIGKQILFCHKKYALNIHSRNSFTRVSFFLI